jgi:hypothetical protein
MPPSRVWAAKGQNSGSRLDFGCSVVNCRGSVQPRRPQQIQRGILRRNPSLEDDPARTRHLGQVAIPRRWTGVGSHSTVAVVVMDEVCEVGQQGAMRSGLC